MEYTELYNQFFVVDLATNICIHCDEAFYKTVCTKFIESTEFEDAYEILDYIADSDKCLKWEGFPQYIKDLKPEELFDVFNCDLDGGGLKPRAFREGDVIHPMFIIIMKEVGYEFKENVIFIDNKEHHIGFVKRIPVLFDPSHIKNLEKNIAIFSDTMEWIEIDDILSSSVDYSKQHTQVYLNVKYPLNFYSINSVDTDIRVINKKTVMAAIEIKEENPNSRVAVLNFANPINPGGAVKKGYMGQEEELCRCSTLYKVLCSSDVCGEYYIHNKIVSSAIGPGDCSLIYSEGIKICKSDEEEPIRLESKKHIDIDVITMAAPYCREIDLEDETLFNIHYNRALCMFQIAHSKGADTLILGAFGCGAFKNNPYIVAKAYKAAISAFPKVFKQIVFAIYNKNSLSVNNYSIFCESLIEH